MLATRSGSRMRCATPGPHTPKPPSNAVTAESARLQKAPARGCEAALSLLMCALLTACSGSPSVGILGAYFPDWLFCVIGGTVLTAVVHVLSYRHGYGSWLTPPAIVYPALTVLFSIVLWAVGFNL
ncbi:YtcA family lipoprotein [Paraburkholderia sp.]|jgi:YtcA family|uniref:YtcA family lipoprotein n=1 Tax=Paraburkholderia sp. TaxID=1926495 RepID=UPI0010642DEC|nr:YtcA family lipoprotein [Paraburkholderia sp.]